MTLELAAIANALQFILEENSGTKKYVVLTDSLSSLQALRGKIKICYQLQNKIKYDIDLIQKQGKIVSFWDVSISWTRTFLRNDFFVLKVLFGVRR